MTEPVSLSANSSHRGTVQRIPTTESAAETRAQAPAERAFRVSVIVSGIRCTLAYVVLPFMTPLLGLAPGIGPAVGLPIGLVAIVANVMSARRFWILRHPWRRPVTVIHALVVAFLLVMIAGDVSTLVGPTA